jgi:uncharacterized protein (DUF302 family)
MEFPGTAIARVVSGGMMTLPRFASILIVAVALAVSGCTETNIGRLTGVSADPGLMLVPSHQSVDDTAASLEQLIEERNDVSLLGTLDYAEKARAAGFELRPTRLIVFGSPRVEAPLLRNTQSAGLDLPQKFLVFEDNEQNVYIAYNDPKYIARRHRIGDMENHLALLSELLGDLATEAATARGRALQLRTVEPTTAGGEE